MILEDSQRETILSFLQDIITDGDQRLLEIGSGSGKDAIYFAPNFPRLEWHPTEGSSKLRSLSIFLDEHKTKNVLKAARLEVGKDELPKLKFDVIFTANTFQNMHWKECKSLMKMFGGRLREGSRVVIAGPFKENGAFKNALHETVEAELKVLDPLKGIRNFEDIKSVMEKNGFELVDNEDLPNGDKLFVFTRLKFIPS